MISDLVAKNSGATRRMVMQVARDSLEAKKEKGKQDRAQKEKEKANKEAEKVKKNAGKAAKCGSNLA